MKNVLLISTDDLFSYQKFRTSFGVEIRTPNLDRLAQMGTLFENAYATTPICNPSRATILTGKSPFETGILGNSEDPMLVLDPRETLPAAFHQAGHDTAIAGKVFHRTFLPSDFAAGILDDNLRPQGLLDQFFGLPFRSGPAPAGYEDADFLDHDTASLVADWLAARTGDTPFMLSVGFSRPHSPMVVPQPWFDLYPIADIVAAGFPDTATDALPDFAKQFLSSVPEETLAARIQAYLASISFMDAQLGRILDAMDAGGLWDSTTVLLFSDHGYHQGSSVRHGKFTLWEEAANAPLIVVDPDQDGAGRTVSTPVGLNQIFATLTQLAGIATPDSVTARSFAGLIDGDLGPYRDGPVLTTIYGSLSMRNGDYRLIRYEDGGLELYDLAADPRQLVNLALDPASAALVREQVAALRETGREDGIRFSDARDVLAGNARDDRLIAGDDVGTLVGGAGDDLYFLSAATAVVEEAGGGTDTVVLRGAPGGERVTWTMPAHVENLSLGIGIDRAIVTGNALDNRVVTDTRAALTVDALAGRDVVFGSILADRIDGGAGDDRLFGFRGDDRLIGGTSDDILVGEFGDDRLIGGRGDDTLHGGPGADVFVFRPGQGTDLVARVGPSDPGRLAGSDFDPLQDRIALSGFDFATPAEARAAFFDGPMGAELVAEGTRIILYRIATADLRDASVVLDAPEPGTGGDTGTPWLPIHDPEGVTHGFDL